MMVKRTINIGGLYSYGLTLDVRPNIRSFRLNAKLAKNEPFVVLDKKSNEHLKILTTQGIIGWVFIIKPEEFLKELT